MSCAVVVAGLSGALLVEAAFREAKGEVPALGIIGPEAVREAFEGDLTQLRDLLQGAVKKALELAGEEEWWPYVHALFDDFIVVEQKDGKLLKYPYEIDGTKVTLGTPQEVVKRFVPAEEGSAASMAEAASPLFIEARDEATYRIRIIKAGLSGNRNYYPDAVLREAVPLFEGTRVFVKSDAEHLSGGGKDVRISDALTFLAGDRSAVGEAWPGDIIGLHNHGTIQIGDTFTQGEMVKFSGIPNFAPELFRRIRLRDPLKAKQLQKGLMQLSEEGAVQVFRPLKNNDLIVGAVGMLQFDVVAQRLKSEYKVDAVYEPISVATARWVECSDPRKLEQFRDKAYDNLALDGGDNLAYVAPTMVNLQMAQERHPDIAFRKTREH